jgi:hypothetical protein
VSFICTIYFRFLKARYGCELNLLQQWRNGSGLWWNPVWWSRVFSC